MAQSDPNTAPFHWQGRHDAEDGELGKRVHHVIKNISVEELPNKSKASQSLALLPMRVLPEIKAVSARKSHRI